MLPWRLPDAPKLILKRSALADAGFEDYEVLSEGKNVGRIYKGQAGASGGLARSALVKPNEQTKEATN